MVRPPGDAEHGRHRDAESDTHESQPPAGGALLPELLLAIEAVLFTGGHKSDCQPGDRCYARDDG